MPIQTLPQEWRNRAELFRQHGATAIAMTLDRAAGELAEALSATDAALLTLPAAAAQSGYSADHLGRLIRSGKIPNAGRPNAPRIRSRDIPCKATTPLRPDERPSILLSTKGRMARTVAHSKRS